MNRLRDKAKSSLQATQPPQSANPSRRGNSALGMLQSVQNGLIRNRNDRLYTRDQKLRRSFCNDEMA